jgi:hypothetical protein
LLSQRISLGLLGIGLGLLGNLGDVTPQRTGAMGRSVSG